MRPKSLSLHPCTDRELKKKKNIVKKLSDDQLSLLTLGTNVGHPDPHDFGLPGSGSII